MRSLKTTIALALALAGSRAHAQQWPEYAAPPGKTATVPVCFRNNTGGGFSCLNSEDPQAPLEEFTRTRTTLRLERALSAGVALSSALDFQSPAPGRSHRLGSSVAAFNDEAGVGFTYTGRAGRLDFGAGLGFAERQTMTKAAVGLSW